jgi:LPS O-antigen subunit length determinant protein (WzzB/FepE family)
MKKLIVTMAGIVGAVVPLGVALRAAAHRQR